MRCARAGDAEEHARRDAAEEARQFAGVKMSEGTKGVLRLTWSVCGSVKIDAIGKLKFPIHHDGPGVYRFSIHKSDGSHLEYIGETDNLRRRFYHYRNPGPTQPTNRRLNALCKQLLTDGAQIEIETADGWFGLNGAETEANFYSKIIRRLFENFALATGFGSEIERLNK